MDVSLNTHILPGTSSASSNHAIPKVHNGVQVLFAVGPSTSSESVEALFLEVIHERSLAQIWSGRSFAADHTAILSAHATSNRPQREAPLERMGGWRGEKVKTAGLGARVRPLAHCICTSLIRASSRPDACLIGVILRLANV